jgi:serine/threonine protein kinase
MSAPNCQPAGDADPPSGRTDPTEHMDRTLSVDSREQTIKQSEWGTSTSEELLEARFDTSLLHPSENKEALGRLGKYDLLSLVGHGGMGIVFRGFDVQLRRIVAIKVLNRELATSPIARRRFIREARAAAVVKHDNIVTIYAVDENTPFLVMEFVDGSTLSERIRAQGPLPPLEVMRLGAQIAAGLAAAHVQGVIHRDIKPGNIMLEDGVNRIKLTDFGLARATIDNVDLTSVGSTVGTPAYMAPELVRGDPIDARADLFGLGCVMYAMLAGSSPFYGQNAFDTARKVTEFDPAPLKELDPRVSGFLSDLVMRLLEKDPDKRIQSAAEVAEQLNQHIAMINQAPSDQLPALMRGDLLPPPARRSRKKRHWVLGAATLVVLSGVIGLLVRPTPQPTPAKLSVSSSGEADCRTIADALERAGPGTKITVLDASQYEGSIVLDQARRWRGLTLEAPGGAQLSAPVDQNSVIEIQNVANVTVTGFQIDVKDRQHGIEIVGPCAGTVVDNVRIRHAGSARASIYLHAGAGGTQEQPIVLRSLDVQTGRVGVVIGQDDVPAAADPVQWVRLENSRILGPERGIGTLLILQSSLDEVEVSNTVFAHGLTGLSFALPETQTATNVKIADNTFFDLNHFLAFLSPSSDQQLLVRSNSIARVDGLLLDSGGIASLPKGIADNRWEKSQALDETHARAVGQLVEKIPFRSTDPASKDYLVPVSRSKPRGTSDGEDTGRRP